MKKGIAAVGAVTLVVMLLSSLLQIQNLQNQVNSMQTAMSGVEERIDRRMLGISERVDHQINEILEEFQEKQQTVFPNVEYTYGEIHMDRKTVDVRITAVPKAYSESHSEASVTVNGQEVPLTLQNGVFQGTVELELFGETSISDARIKNQGEVGVQSLDWSLNPRYSILPVFGVAHTGSDETDKKDGMLQWASDRLFELNAYSERPFQIQSMVLIEERNGTEIGRIPADLSSEGQKEYAVNVLRAGSNEAMAVPEQAAPVVDLNGAKEDGTTDVRLCLYTSKTYALSRGDTLIRYLELTDDRGFRYRCFADCCAVTDSLRRDHERESEIERQFRERGCTIYDSDGMKIT